MLYGVGGEFLCCNNDFFVLKNISCINRGISYNIARNILHRKNATLHLQYN